MHTNKLAAVQVKLSLAVQYATPMAELSRPQIRRWVQRTLNAARHDLQNTDKQAPLAAELTVRFVDADEGRQLNYQYRERDYATNVLTFEYGMDPAGCTHADIVLCTPVLRQEAKDQCKPLLHHAAHLVTHGVLHALGYDHIDPAEARQMEQLETQLLATLHIADPYHS